MHMNRKFVLVPLLSLFLVGCNGGEPFANDEYKPKGMTPSHKIVRALNMDETALFDDSIGLTDIYLRSFTQTIEARIYEKKALPNHITSSTFDGRLSESMSHRIYENGVFKTEIRQENELIYQGSTMSSEAQAAYYGVLNEEETEISLTLDLTDESGEHVVAVSTEPYSAEDDYDDYFAIDFSASVWSEVGSCSIGMTEAGLLAATNTTSDVTPPGSEYVAPDGSEFILETNRLFEAYFAKGVDEDSEAEYYYLVSSRIYQENLIISYEVPNIADVAVTYRERPVLLAYQEVIINSSTATNNNFALDSIPAATAEEEE